MRLLFWRRKGRHALGAAVTAIPTGPGVLAPAPVPAPAPAPAPAGEPDLLTSIAQLIASGEAWVEPGERVASPRPASPTVTGAAPIPAGPRVQLTFRDGTSAMLEPGSEQSLAIEQIASSLTRRG